MNILTTTANSDVGKHIDLDHANDVLEQHLISVGAITPEMVAAKLIVEMQQQNTRAAKSQ
jgi:hypothetical protein